MPLYLAIVIVIGLGLVEQFVTAWLGPFGVTIPLTLVGVTSIIVARPQLWLLGLLAGLIIDVTSLTPFGMYAVWYLFTGAATRILSQRYPKYVTWVVPPVAGIAVLLSTACAGLLSAPVFWPHISAWTVFAVIRASETMILTFLLLLPRLHQPPTTSNYESRTILR